MWNGVQSIWRKSFKLENITEAFLDICLMITIIITQKINKKRLRKNEDWFHFTRNIAFNCDATFGLGGRANISSHIGNCVNFWIFVFWISIRRSKWFWPYLIRCGCSAQFFLFRKGYYSYESNDLVSNCNHSLCLSQSIYFNSNNDKHQSNVLCSETVLYFQLEKVSNFEFCGYFIPIQCYDSSMLYGR